MRQISTGLVWDSILCCDPANQHSRLDVHIVRANEKVRQEERVLEERLTQRLSCCQDSQFKTCFARRSWDSLGCSEFIWLRRPTQQPYRNNQGASVGWLASRVSLSAVQLDHSSLWLHAPWKGRFVGSDLPYSKCVGLCCCYTLVWDYHRCTKQTPNTSGLQGIWNMKMWTKLPWIGSLFLN